MGPEEYYGYQQQQAGGFTQNDGDQKRRIIIAGIGFFFLIIMLLIGRALFFTTPTVDPQVAQVASSHSEIVRIATLGIKSQRAGSESRAYAASLKAIALTNLTEISTYAAGSPDLLPIAGESLSSRANEELDARLEDAALINNYEDVFEDILDELVANSNTVMVANYGEFNHLPTLQGIIDTASSRYAAFSDAR